MNRLQANLLLLAAAFIWGTTFIVQQIGMEKVGPLIFTGVRFLLGALVVLPLALREQRRFRREEKCLTARHWAAMVLVGCAIFGGAYTQQVGIMYTTVTNAGFLTAIYVPMVPVMSLIFLRKAPHWSVWPAGIGCVAGAYLLSGAGEVALNIGDIWVMGSAFLWAMHFLLVGAVAMRTGAPLTVACVQFVVCGVLGTVAALMLENVTLAALASAIPEILYAGVLAVGVGFTLQVVGQRYTPPSDAAILVSCEAVFAAIAGALFLDERLNGLELTGCALILAGALAVQLVPLARMRLARSQS